MMKILILYFSGVGATKKIAGLFYTALPKSCAADMFSMEDSDIADISSAGSGSVFNINEYDALIIGTPTYHAAPARAVMDYFAGIKPPDDPKPAFIYNTRGLYSCNTNRILAKHVWKKNIITVMDRAYRGPASDVSLMLPALEAAFTFDKNIREKTAADCARFIKLLNNGNPRGYIPRFQLSGILNAPNKLAGQFLTVKIHLHRDWCVKCGKCIADCPYRALEADVSGYPALKANASGYPLFKKDKCENCYRCIHHCPRMALSLSGRRKTDRVLPFL